MKTICPNCNETVLFTNFDYYSSIIANWFATFTIERNCNKCKLSISIYSDYIYFMKIENFSIDQTKIAAHRLIKFDFIIVQVFNEYDNTYPHYITIDNFKLSNIKYIFNKLNTFKNNQLFL